MAELGIPDPFDDDAGEWEGMGDPVHLEGMVWDGHQDTYADSSLFALLDHLDVEDGDPALAGFENGASLYGVYPCTVDDRYIKT